MLVASDWNATRTRVPVRCTAAALLPPPVASLPLAVTLARTLVNGALPSTRVGNTSRTALVSVAIRSLASLSNATIAPVASITGFSLLPLPPVALAPSWWLASSVVLLPTRRTNTSLPVPFAVGEAGDQVGRRRLEALTVCAAAPPIPGAVDAPLPALVVPVIALHSTDWPSR